jgi:ribonuclease E
VHRIDEQLAKAMDRKVWLPSGGTLVIDRTEAMTVVDVNTGKFTGSGGNLEQTVTKNNLEAAEEIVRQLRLRDIGGIIVIDFIDMVLESNRDLVLRRLTEALARDRTRHQVSEVTSLGLVQLTRKRLGTGLIEAFSTSCPNCGGRGLLLHADPVDSAPSNGRKSESGGSPGSGGGGGGRRGRRSKKSRSEEPGEKDVVAKVPVHAPGEHPMFKAMAAGTSGSAEDDESDEVTDELTADLEEGTEERVPADQEDLVDADQEDFEDTDEETDEDEDELDDDEEDLDDDDEDLDDVDEDLDDLDDEDDLEDSDDAEDSDDSDEDDPDVHHARDNGDIPVGTVSVVGQHRRRRAAGRPAGPPVHVD